MWFGIGTLARPAAPRAEPGEPTPSGARWALRGWGVSGLNPKVLLLILALLPQFTDADGGWPLPVQIGVLGAVHLTSCAVIYTSVALAARRVLRARPAAARVVSRVSGVVMIGLGVLLGLEQVVGR